MKTLLNLFLLIPFVFASDVLEFKDSNFQKSIKEHSVILVEFYAPWCGHCKKLAPEYEIAATTLKKQDPPIPIAKVDCTAETKTCEKYGVSGYPTLKIFKNGVFSSEYSGERSGDGIIKYMISKSGPSSKELKTEESVIKFTTSSADSVIVGFFEKESSDLYKTFLSVADDVNEDFRFAHVLDKEILSKFNFNNDIVIYRPHKMANKFEDVTSKYKGDSSKDMIRAWIEENVMGLAGLRSSSNMKYFEEKPLVVAFFKIDYENNAKSTNYWRNRFMKVAKKFVDAGEKIHFAVSDSQQLIHELSEFGIERPDNTKVYITARDDKNQKFLMSKDFSMESFESFLNDLISRKLLPYLKSEDIPAKNDEPVKVVVAKTFDEIVNDPTKDVLIEFYAPWCGHCKSLAPKYDELATKLLGESDIVIAKMDATANDVPSPYEVTGFPTIYFAPKKSKQSPKSYVGGREVDDMVKYIASEASSPLKGYDSQGRVRKSEL